MKSKKIGLSSKDREKLAKIIAEEEKAVLSDEDLDKEEELMSQSIQTLLNNSPKQEGGETPSPNQDQIWAKIKSTIENNQHNSNTNIVHSIGEAKSNAWKAWSGIIAAAAAVFLIVLNNRNTEQTIEPGYTGFKGTEHSQVNCEYQFWSASKGAIPGDGLVYRAIRNSELQIKMNCDQAVVLHLLVEQGGQSYQVANTKINSLGLLEDSSGTLVSINLSELSRVYLFGTSSVISDSIKLNAQEDIKNLGTQDLKWKDQTTIELVRGGQ